MGADGMRLAGICKDCMKRLGVDERLTIPLKFVQVSQLSEYNEKAMAGVHFPGTAQAFGSGRGGQTKITYKIAKTVKEVVDESNLSHASMRSKPNGGGGSSNSSSSKL